jgi:hypothetical protein
MGQEDEGHTGQHKECQRPLEIQEAGDEQEGRVRWGMDTEKSVSTMARSIQAQQPSH